MIEQPQKLCPLRPFTGSAQRLKGNGSAFSFCSCVWLVHKEVIRETTNQSQAYIETITQHSTMFPGCDEVCHWLCSQDNTQWNEQMNNLSKEIKMDWSEHAATLKIVKVRKGK